MSDTQPTVSIIVLSYNRPALLREALRSLVEQSYAPLEIILVDNRSPASDEIARVAGEFPVVRLIRNSENLGFTVGMNMGIAEASGEYIYLTEDDMTLDTDCIRHLTEYGNEHLNEGLLTPILYNKAAGTIRCAGGEVSLNGVHRMKIHGEGRHDKGQFPQPFDVTYVDGAVIFARTGFLRALGGFREEYFMYVDAVELSVRVAKCGGRMTVVPWARVCHFEPPVGAPLAPGLDFHKYKNFFSLYLLHAPVRCLPEFFCRYALLALVRALLGRGGDARSLLKAIMWVSRRTPSLLKERRRAARAQFETKGACDGEGIAGRVFDKKSKSGMKAGCESESR